MDAFLDQLWYWIVQLAQACVQGMNFVFSPLDALGPAPAISVLAFVTVAFTKLVGSRFKTKRYLELEKEFIYWRGLREEAMKYRDQDPEKAKLLAKNIDQAQLNRVYYDYFFEGFMLSLFSKYLPMLIMLAYVNESYRPERLLARWGRDHLFMLGWFSDKPQPVGAVFWFVVSLVGSYVLWWLARLAWRRVRGADTPSAPAGGGGAR